VIVGMYLPDKPKSVPKTGMPVRTASAIHFAGRYRLIDFTLSNLVNSGVTNILFLLGAHYQSLVDHIGSGRDWDLSRKNGGVKFFPPYLTDKGNGAFERAVQYLEENKNADTVMLCDGSVYYNLNYKQAIHQHNAEYSAATMIVGTQKDKPLNTIIFRRETILKVLGSIDNGDWSYDNVISILKKLYKVNIYEFGGYYGKIDTLEDFYNCNMELLKPENRKALFEPSDGGRIYTSSRDSLPTRYGKNAIISNSFVADGCQIDGVVENSLIFRRVKVDSGAVVRNSIIQEDAVIEYGAELSNIITDRNVKITAGRKIGSKDELLYLEEDSVI